MPEREAFLLALDACEKTSARLLLALGSGTPEAATLAACRDEQIGRLSAILPAEICAGDLERLKWLLSVGQEAHSIALAARTSATRNLTSLRRDLQVTRQLAATRDPRQPGIDCMG